MAQPIIYKPEQWQQRGIVTLLQLLHDAVYDPDTNRRIQTHDYSDLDKYFQNPNHPLRKVMIDAANAADEWVTRRRKNPTEDHQDSHNAYSDAMDKIMKEVTKEMHAEAFSIIW
jgi:hypothetical protein